MSAKTNETLVKHIVRYLAALVMVGIGVKHFTHPDGFVRIMPDYIPEASHLALVYISGVFEILGGLGLLIPKTRKLAAWGLIALYIAVFPANIYMATESITTMNGVELAPWMLWARLPLQFVFIGLAYWFTKMPKDEGEG